MPSDPGTIMWMEAPGNSGTTRSEIIKTLEAIASQPFSNTDQDGFKVPSPRLN